MSDNNNNQIQQTNLNPNLIQTNYQKQKNS